MWPWERFTCTSYVCVWICSWHLHGGQVDIQYLRNWSAWRRYWSILPPLKKVILLVINTNEPRERRRGTHATHSLSHTCTHASAASSHLSTRLPREGAAVCARACMVAKINAMQAGTWVPVQKDPIYKARDLVAGDCFCRKKICTIKLFHVKNAYLERHVWLSGNPLTCSASNTHQFIM